MPWWTEDVVPDYKRQRVDDAPAAAPGPAAATVPEGVDKPVHLVAARTPTPAFPPRTLSSSHSLVTSLELRRSFRDEVWTAPGGLRENFLATRLNSIHAPQRADGPGQQSWRRHLPTLRDRLMRLGGKPSVPDVGAGVEKNEMRRVPSSPTQRGGRTLRRCFGAG